MSLLKLAAIILLGWVLAREVGAAFSISAEGIEVWFNELPVEVRLPLAAPLILVVFLSVVFGALVAFEPLNAHLMGALEPLLRPLARAWVYLEPARSRDERALVNYRYDPHRSDRRRKKE